MEGSSRGKFTYQMPRGTEYRQYEEMIENYPEEDNPEVFKLHANADITCRIKETREMISTVMETRPKEGGGGGESREEKVKKIV